MAAGAVLGVGAVEGLGVIESSQGSRGGGLGELMSSRPPVGETSKGLMKGLFSLKISPLRLGFLAISYFSLRYFSSHKIAWLQDLTYPSVR